MSEQEEPQPIRKPRADLVFPAGKKYFTPKEAAKVLGITENSLKGHRQRGHIEAAIQEEYTTLYTVDNLLNADIQPHKRGPKPKKRPQAQSDSRAAYATYVA